MSSKSEMFRHLGLHGFFKQAYGQLLDKPISSIRSSGLLQTLMSWSSSSLAMAIGYYPQLKFQPKKPTAQFVLHFPQSRLHYIISADPVNPIEWLRASRGNLLQ